MSSNINAENFDTILNDVRRKAPAVGLAALSGKTPNRALQQSYKILSDAGVKLERGAMNYPWRSLQKANPRLAHSIEEVLVFGDALFTAISKKQSPESLKADFIEVKQRFAKIVKETESLALPKEEKSLFSFFDKGAKKPEEKTELRLNNLDQLLEEAHVKSRELLEKTESDLLIERSFNSAVEWFVLALEDAQVRIKNAEKDGSLVMPASELVELTNALGSSQIVTQANMATSQRFLQIKEDLHNKSISFLTAHENTFTVIQGHLRSWKDIKTQTESLNALSDTVKAGSALLSSASIGVETTVHAWNGELINKETLSALSNSFGDYDQEISTLVSNLNATQNSDQQQSHWEQWEQTKKNIVDPVRESVQNEAQNYSFATRPVLRKATDKVEKSVVSEFVYNDEEPAPKPRAKEVKQFNFSSNKPWTEMDKIVVNKKLAAYAKTVGLTLSAHAAEQNWAPAETMARVSAPLLAVGTEQLSSAPLVLRSQVDYVVRYGNPLAANWNNILDQKVLVSTQPDWEEKFQNWMSSKDDLDWANLMQWNDLVYDLLIFEQDADQKHSVLTGASANDIKVRESLVERITDFANAPGVSSEDVKEWGFSGLITRYAAALNMNENVIDKLWALWHNPKHPIDWNEEQATSWNEKYKDDMATVAGQRIVSQLLDQSAPDLYTVSISGSRIKSQRPEGESNSAPRHRTRI